MLEAQYMTGSEKNAMKRELQQALGQVLRRLREARHDSQQILAEAAGMDRSYWGDLERGERSLTLYNLWRIAEALEMSPSRLVQTIDKMRRQVHSAPQRPVSIEMKRLKIFMDQSPTMKWLADPKQNCVYCNEPLLRFFGLPLEKITGQQWRELMHPDDREKYRATNRKHFAKRQPYISKYRIRRADGKHVWVVQRATPQFTPKGVFLGFLGAMIPEPNGTG